MKQTLKYRIKRLLDMPVHRLSGCTVAASTQLLQVTLASGGVLYYKPSSDQVFLGSKKYKYEITVNLSGLTVTSTIANWEPVDGRTGVAEME